MLMPPDGDVATMASLTAVSTENQVPNLMDRLVAHAVRASVVDYFHVRGEAVVNVRAGAKGNAPIAATRGRSQSLGIRVWAHGGVGYAASTEAEPDLARLVAAAARSARSHARLARAIPPPRAVRDEKLATPVRDPLDEADDALLFDLVTRAAEAASAASAQAGTHAVIGARIATRWLTDGMATTETRAHLSTLLAMAQRRADGRVGDGTARWGGTRGARDFVGPCAPEALGAEAAKRLEESLDASPVKAGRMRVLCDPELAGTLAHESFGHLTEYDLVHSGWSTLHGHMGERLGAPGVTIRDSPVTPQVELDGVQVPVDDEGTRGRTVTMLDDGHLNAWLHSGDTAALVDAEPTGNARVLDARFSPMVRMRNTYFAAGDARFDEALEQLGDGLYLCGARGGAPNPDGGFMFTALRGYRVERGQVVAPVRGPAIHGGILDFLQRVECVTDTVEMHTNYFGGCGKREQSFMHVGVGGPHVLVSEALVGGVA